MRSRRHGSKPALALWLLIAVLDVALLAAAAGPLLFVLVTAALGGAILGGRSLWSHHHTAWRPWTVVSRTYAHASRQVTVVSRKLPGPAPVRRSATSRTFASPPRRLVRGS